MINSPLRYCGHSLLFSVMNEYEEDTWSKYVVDNNANVGNMFGNRAFKSGDRGVIL